MRRRPALLAVLLLGCSSGPPEPATLDTRNDACAFCRMSVSDARFAGQLVAPGEEPMFFDDLGCLRDYLRRQGQLPSRSLAYVADHRTRAWVAAARAVLTKLETLETPMGSHVIAHADAGSRDADPDARGGTPLTASEFFGPGGPPEARP